MVSYVVFLLKGLQEGRESLDRKQSNEKKMFFPDLYGLVCDVAAVGR